MDLYGGLSIVGATSQFTKEEIENCRAGRLLFFGSDYQFRDNFEHEVIGPKEEVIAAWQKFSMMDDDRSGRVGIEEFRAIVADYHHGGRGHEHARGRTRQRGGVGMNLFG